jgi:hypothetical protein
LTVVTAGYGIRAFNRFTLKTGDVDMAPAVDAGSESASLMAAECLKPWPEQGDAMMMRSLPG